MTAALPDGQDYPRQGVHWDQASDDADAQGWLARSSSPSLAPT